MRSIGFLFMLIAAFPAYALLTRADRDDAEYLELATRFPAAVTIAPGVEGVLIAPRWVLTSASAATVLQGAKLRPPLTLGGKPNAIQASFSHPEWRQGPDADLALVLLKDPVDTIVPMPISRDRDEVEEAVFVMGHGEHGPIGKPPRPSDGRKRAGINTVDRVFPGTLRLQVKPPDEASDLQGVAARDERGAPAVIEARTDKAVAGIFSRNEGEWQVFARVSSYVKWIDETMFRAAVEEAALIRK